ncbi:hypothetical protein PANT_25c00019 [Moesziomyces antarcticus T-34]|uniref:Rpr2-domain-containing protein n=1 Tax=Pseudozyma antarctica (strain T-34) TaxID=1151754 RepID=M9M0T3_PSEA3|nr:hypothetical protein PANT_25c00019 [Moesziomyces antarcticus T-34]
MAKSNARKAAEAGGPTTKPGAGKGAAGWVVPKTVAHPEHHHTLNHLDQVSTFYSVLSSALAGEQGAGMVGLQGEMVRSARTLSRKAVIRLDTSVKRSACPKCSTAWIEGLTLAVRCKTSGPHDHVLKKQCRVCGTSVRIPAPNVIDLPPHTRVLDEPQQEAKASGDGDQREGEKKQRMSQRQRRHVAALQRDLLNGSKPSTSARLSRRQRSQLRQVRLSRRTEAAPLPAPRKPRSPSKPKTTVGPPSSTQTEAQDADSGLGQPWEAGVRVHLPQFNDRVAGTGWDDALVTLSSLPSSTDSQSLDVFTAAARARGDHTLVRAIGKNGSLGPQLP